ncbi:MAG: cytochrome b/b6 domain protein [Actinomycetia bacterium]|nr:cytochrome b/b6 domain protein [Actinomycetes bacterium]
MMRRLVRWVDERLGGTHFAREALNKVFPDHWSFMLGEVAMYCFVILVATGTYLTFFFNPSPQDVVYHGSYKALRGVHMSEAYRSTLRISFDVRAGLVMRQIHHWTALLFVAVIVVHLCRVFFTGAFRKPRELNWMVGVTLLVLALANGFTGYSLPDDLLSGTGLRVAYSFVLSIPVVGTWLAFLIFGGEFPAGDILNRLFVIHILVVPVLIGVVLSAHLAILWRQKHSQFRGRGRKEHNVVGSKLWPTYTMKSGALFAAVIAIVALLGGLAQINPIWLYGPFTPAAVSTGAQPDWYLGWTEGAIRLFPPWDIHIFHHTISEVFWPSIALPGITFLLLYLWPFLEARFTGDHEEHHLLDRPSDRPVRTAIGIGVLAFYVVLTVAGGQDIIAQKLQVSVVPVTRTLQVLVFVVPIIAALFTWRLCRDIRKSGSVRIEEGQTEIPVGPNEEPLVDEDGEAIVGTAGGTVGMPPDDRSADARADAGDEAAVPAHRSLLAAGSTVAGLAVLAYLRRRLTRRGRRVIEVYRRDGPGG